MNEQPLISVVVPCYNEKDNILPLVDAIHRELGAEPHEIIVVDDNSPDGTYDAVVEKSDPLVRAIRRTADPSLGKSVRTGLETARGGIVVVMDSDFNHQPKYLPQMIVNMKFYDCVAASRFLYGGEMDVRWRHLASWVFNIWARIMTNTQITDSLYGFYAIRRAAIEQLDYDKIFWGFGDYGIRLMYYIQKRDFSVLQFPAVNGKRRAGKGNSSFFKVLFQYFSATLRLVFSELKS